MKNIEIFDNAVAKCERIERKGKTMPYTSANGYMFSLVNKDHEIGIRFSKERQEELMKKHTTSIFKSHNAIMKGYILIPDQVLKDTDLLVNYLNESYDYVMSLPKK
jgi:hypothetical protein